MLTVVADRVDRVAAALAVVGLLTTFRVLRIRTHKAARRAGLVVTAGATIVGFTAALALPVIAMKPDALIVNVPSEASPWSLPKPLANQIKARDGKTVLGFAATDYDDTAGGLDIASQGLSVVAATGVTLGDVPGSVVSAPIEDSIVRAHIAGANGYAVVSNYRANDFSSRSVNELLFKKGAKDRFVASIASIVAKCGCDGVVVDFESLKPEVRIRFPQLLRSLKKAIGGKPVLATVPAFTDPEDLDSRAYDLGALAAAGDGLILMAYDEHDAMSGPGPIAALTWVEQLVVNTLRVVPAEKLLLGVPTFGYRWPNQQVRPVNVAQEVTAKEGVELKNILGNKLAYDSASGERHGTLRDGGEVWFVDERGTRERTAIATSHGLKGVALWRIGAETPGTVASLPLIAKKQQSFAPNRPIKNEQKTGVVALTFDDGPDPQWTEKILAILREKKISATFFVVAKQVEKHPELVSQMMHDGDVIGNHSYSHLDTSTAGVIRNQIDIVAGNAVIEGLTGRRPRLFRAPYGGGDSTKNHKGADEIATNLGMHPVGWNVDPNDWSKPGVAAIVQRVVENATERSVVLLHDGGGDRSQTVAALPQIIDELQARGFVFTTVDGLDASIGLPYSMRYSRTSRARGLAIIAGFRLQLAFRKLFLWVVVATALIAFLRVLFAGPLALWQVLTEKKRRLRLLAIAHVRPTVAVLVPAYNEGQLIRNTLLALAACNPQPNEVLILDDGSTDDTASSARMAIEEIAERFPGACRFTLRTLTNGGKARALNTGTEMATSDVILVIDADTIVDEKIIEHMALHFRDPKVGAVAGNVKVGNRRNILAALQTLEYVIALNLDRRAQDVARVMAVVPGAAGAFRRSALLAIGGYPTDTLVEDADLTQMMLREGWRIPYEPLAVAWTEAPQSLRDVVKQRRRWSFGTIQVVNKHKHAVFEPKAGPLGFIGLPWMLITQVALPVLGPLADVYLLYLVVIGAKSQALGILALAFVSDLVLAVVAVALDRERPGIVFLAPLLRIVWRPLQLWIVVSSARRFARGEDESWRKITRYNSVSLRLGTVNTPTAASEAALP
jgi:peptidoglycan-N-acetylglucosamine deacetylase